MKLRSFIPSDMDELKRIHSLYFADQFTLPNFLNFVCAYVVEDDEGIITFAGIRHIPECVTVTDYSRSPTDRIKALYQVLDMSRFVTRRVGHDQIYVWTQIPKWAKRLKRNGFREPQGESLILDL